MTDTTGSVEVGPLWDPSDTDGISEDWLDRLVALARDHRVLKTPRGLLFTRLHDIQRLVNHPALKVPVVEQWTMQGVASGPLVERAKRVILNLDGPTHDRLRGFVKRAFTPRQVDRLASGMRRHLVSRLDAVSGPQIDFLGQVVADYPAAVIAGVLGVPSEDVGTIASLADTIVSSQFSFGAETPRILAEAGAEMDRYLLDLVASRRSTPTDDLLGSLVAAEVHGDRLADEELVSLASSIISAGIDTTRHQACLAVTLFSENPEQWSELRRDTDLASNAVEEVLRLRPTTPLLSRITKVPLEIDGLAVPAGTFISLAAVLANRDPELNDRPDELDLRRSTPRHLTFGFGPHYCLGASLARLELTELLTVMAGRFERIEIIGDVPRRSCLGTYGVRSLLIRGA